MKSRRSGTGRTPAKKKTLKAAAPSRDVEMERLSELRELKVLDTAPEEEFNDLATLAAHVCEAPVALITFLDENRQWFKARVGLDQCETMRATAFCNYAIRQPNLFVVPDALVDERFANNPLVTMPPNLRFYAGVPLLTSGGNILGTMCVLDTVPRELKPDQVLALKVLSRHVITLLELRRSNAQRCIAEEALRNSHATLERAVTERTAELQKARAEAIAARREVTHIIERVSDGLVALDTDSHYTYINKKAAELLGRRPEDLLGKHIWTEFPLDREDPLRAALRRAVIEQKPVTIESFYKPWNRWFENRIYPSRNGVSIFFREITEQKQADERLARERNLSESIIACLPGVFYLFNAQGKFLRWNSQAEKTTGLTHDQFAAKAPLETIHPADRQAVEHGITKAFEEGESTTEARILCTDGTATWHLCTGKRIILDGEMCLLGLAVDISERRRAEEMLRDAQTRLELAVQASGVGLWDWDILNDFAFVSPEWRAQFGFEEPELVHPFVEWEGRLHPDDREKAVSRLRAFMTASSCEYQAEARLLDNHGRYRWIFTRAQLHRNEQGQPIRMLGCHIDVTVHRETEERLRRQREQLRALATHLNSVREEEAGRIARELHDELGSALTGLKIDVNRLGQRLGKDTVDAQRTHIQTILSSVDSTIRSVRKICLDLRPAVLDQLGLSAAVEWLVTEFQTRTGIPCDLRQPESVSIGSDSATTIFRILQELLTNVARHSEATKVQINLRQEPDKLILELQDNGRGLSADALTRLDRFGLLSVRERALAVGGKVDFQSVQSRGTRVVLSVPIE